MSNDIMTFPATVEEFMDEYKIVDVDHVYTNGTELVPIFRMRQWFEHSEDMVEVVRCKDCTYWLNAEVNEKGFVICPASGMEITEDDFCSYGEKVTE